MSAAIEPEEEMRRLLRSYVPEVADGTVEVVSVAGDIGCRTYVAVRSHVPHVDPVGVCSGERGARLKAIGAEWKCVDLTVVRWDKSPEAFIQNAFGMLEPPQVTLEPVTGEAQVTVKGTTVRERDVWLIGELTGWKIRLRIEE